MFRTDFNNFPGLQSQKYWSNSMIPFYFRREKFGFSDQCRSINANLTGQYVFVKEFAHGLQENWEDIPSFIDCLSECPSSDETVCPCFNDIKWIDYFTKQGRCYPSACSSAQLLMVISRRGTNESVFETTNIGQHGQKSDDSVQNFEYSVQTFTEWTSPNIDLDL